MLEELKASVLKVAVQAQREGLCKHKSGNFSARDKKSGLIVMTPTGKDREELIVDDMIIMNENAEVLENKTHLRPTSEALMHLEIYKTRPDVTAIVHTHSMYATVFAVLNRPVPAVVYEMQHLNCKKGRIPVAPYGRPGSVALSRSVIEPCKEADCFLLQGHGAVAVDEESIDGAYLKANYIEELSELYYRLLTVGQGAEPPHFPAEELQKWAYPKEIKLK